MVQLQRIHLSMQETWVQSLGQEDPLEEGMATHSSVLAWRIPWTEEPGGLQSMGLQRVRLGNSATTMEIHHSAKIDLSMGFGARLSPNKFL